MPIGLLVALNNALGPNGPFVAATVLAIAASVALSSSLEMTSRGIEREAKRTSEALAGLSQIEVVGGEIGVPESLVSEIGALPSVKVASPLINAVVRVEGTQFPLHILGIDLTLAADSRRLEVSSGGALVNDPLRLLAKPDAVLITPTLAERLGVDQAGTVRVRSALGLHGLSVQGLLEGSGVASAFNGHVVVMDVYALQQMFHREGFVDRIDVVAEPGQSLDTLIAGIERLAMGRATVRLTGSRRSALDQTISALRIGVLIVSIVGSLVSGLLSYAAMSTSVERRLREFRVLRSTGASAVAVAGWIALDAALAAGLGTGIGVVAGRITAIQLIPTLSRVSEYFGAAPMDPSDVTISGTTIALAIAVGVVCALCGAVGPMRTATRRYALDDAEFAFGEGLPQRESRRRHLLVVATGMTTIAAGSLDWGPASLRIALVLCAGAGLLLFVTRPALRWLDLQRGWLSRMVPGIGHLLGTGLMIRPRGTALAVASIASLVAFVHGAIIVSASFGETLIAMVAARYPEAIMVTASPPFVDGDLGEVKPEVVVAIEATPTVRRYIERFSSTVLFRGAEVSIVAYPAREPHGLWLAPEDARDTGRISEALGRGSICVSNAFARKFALKEGDSVVLPTPQGPHSFSIAGVIPGLAGPSGTIYIDISVFDRIWPRPGATAVYIWPEREPDDVIQEVRRRTENTQPLFFTNNADLLEDAQRFATRFDGLLYGVGTLAIVLGAIAVANLLAAMVAARRVEFALLRAAGAAPAQISALVLCDALLVAVIGLTAGGVLGYLLSSPMLDLMGAEFGLRVQRHVDVSRFSILALSIVSAVAVFSIYPSWSARRSRDLEL